MNFTIQNIEHKGSTYELKMVEDADSARAEVWKDGIIVGRFMLKNKEDGCVSLDYILQSDIKADHF
jgi:hypothetical protein